MKESLAHALSGPVSLAEDEWRERPVDRLHAIASSQILRDQDAKCRWARRSVALCSLGVDVYPYLTQPDGSAGVSAAFLRAQNKLVEYLGWNEFRHELSLRRSTKIAVARQALLEHKNSTCRVCNGKTDENKIPSIPDVDRLKNWKEGDGPVPMKACPACNGTGKHQWTDDERFNSMGIKHKVIDKAMSVAHELISSATIELEIRTRNLRG